MSLPIFKDKTSLTKFNQILNDCAIEKQNHLKKQGKGSDVPIWYENREYSKIIDYVKDEANCFLNFTSEAQRILGQRFMEIKQNV